MTAADMEAKGLIRAQIMTLKGNTVWRWVKPDNPNIIGAMKKAVAKPQAAVKKAVAAVLNKEPPKPVGYRSQGWQSCCGASFHIPVFPVETKVKRSKAEWTALWEVSPWAAYYQRAKRDVDYYKRSGYSSDAKYYEETMKRYSLEAFIEADGNISVQVQTKTCSSPGICVSTAPFENATELLPGIWGRKDQEPINLATDDFFDPVEQLDKLPTTGTDRAWWIPDPANTKLRVITSVDPPALGQSIWATLKPGKLSKAYNIYDRTSKKEYLSWEAGDTVLFILNNSQRNNNGHTTPKNLAANGFKELLRTGNKTHSETSTVYLYGRTLTQKDVELLNAK